MLGLVVTIISSLWLTLTTLWLYRVQRTVSRIGITTGMMALLRVVVHFPGNANIKEILGATAPFAAVEVVIIGSANGK
jgi:hypothetical protein